jgi:hypothetical protein
MEWIGREGRFYLDSASDFRTEINRRFSVRGAVADGLRGLLLAEEAAA